MQEAPALRSSLEQRYGKRAIMAEKAAALLVVAMAGVLLAAAATVTASGIRPYASGGRGRSLRSIRQSAN
jgi:hypothetical protein